MANYKAKFISGDPNDGTKDFSITFELYRDDILINKYIDSFQGSGLVGAYTYKKATKEIYIKADDYFYDAFGAWGREGTKYNLPINDISKDDKINIEGYVFPEEPSTPTNPTGDIKIFVDAFNTEFDKEIKSLSDLQSTLKNTYSEAIKISTPRTSTWPKDASVVTIGDLFKYTFPDISTDTFMTPPEYTSYVGGTTPIVNPEKQEDYNSWDKDLKSTPEIKKMFNDIKRGLILNTKIKKYNEIKKPGITNPSLYSPGQYYFDFFMDTILSSNGAIKSPSDGNGGNYAFDSEFRSKNGTSSVSLFDATGEVEISRHDAAKLIDGTGSLDYYEFSEILKHGYTNQGIKYEMEDYFGVDIIGEGDDTTPSNSFTSLKKQYKSGLLNDLKDDPKFNPLRGEIVDATGKVSNWYFPEPSIDVTGYQFTGNYEHILLYKAFVQAGDNYKSVVLPYYGTPPPEPETPPSNVSVKVQDPTAVGEVQFKFNVEKTDTFIVVGGTVSPALEFTIVPNDGSEYIIDTSYMDDKFDDSDLDDEYKEDVFAGDEELKNVYDSYIVQLEAASGQNLTPEEKDDIAKEIVKYKPGKPSKTPPPDVVKAMKDYGITSPLEQAHFLAQCAHESGQFAWKREFASGKAYEGRSDLGNTSAGDGVRYKGRGYIQITGKANYTSYNKYLKGRGINDDVVANPELLEGKYAADCSVWFWCVAGPSGVKNFPKKAKEGASVDVVTKISKWVNGGTNGLNDRIEKFGYYWSVLEKNGSAYS